MLKILHPKEGWEDQAEGSETDSSGKTQEVVENRDSLGNDKSKDSESKIATNPGSPMNHRVLLKMVRVAEDSDENVLRGHVLVNTDTDNKTWKRNSIRDLLEQRACTSESRGRQPYAAP